MNHRAIDAGATAFVPGGRARRLGRRRGRGHPWPALGRASGAGEDGARHHGAREPHGRRPACRCRPSWTHADGQFPHGRRRLREARRGRDGARLGALTPASSATSCSYVCPHATIRPFALYRGRRPPAAPGPDQAGARARARRPRRPATSSPWPCRPLDCMGCARVRRRVPHQLSDHGAHTPTRWASRRCSTSAWPRWPPSPSSIDATVKGSQFKPAAAGVLRLLRRLRRNLLRAPGHPAVRRPHVHRQRHGLLVDLGRSGGGVALHGEQATATALRGATRCSRTTPSTAWACCWATRRCATRC